MKLINETLFDETTGKAKTSPRLRMNHNFHDDLDDPINRMINAIEPGSYLRPHRHQNPDKEEIFFVLRGSAAFFLFDGEGRVTDSIVLDPHKGMYGMEIEPGVWHSLIALETGTIVYEIKRGPFIPLDPQNFAPWSPEPDDKEEVQKYMEGLKKHL